MENIFKISEKNQNIAWEIIDDTDIFNLWNSEGARVNIVGSLITGLMMKHRDIDLHIYSKNISMEKAENVLKDEEGCQIMRILGRNMAWILKCIEAGKNCGITPAQTEEKIWTNFIR